MRNRQAEVDVPSLYVRVYRLFLLNGSTSSGSLTIREGISIEYDTRSRYTLVPSLYVRVYQKRKSVKGDRLRSLTIREGISREYETQKDNLQFPHYT